MKIRWRCLTVFLAAFVLFAGLAHGQETFQLQAYENLKMEILPESVFNARFGNNPEIPRSEEAVLALAHKLYPPQAFKEEPLSPTEEPGDCGEPDVGVLFAALKNPAISDAVRMLVDNIIAEAIPSLPKFKISPSGHFKIYYTSTDANHLHNVTDAEIESLATLLDSYWNTYATNFKKPKYYMVGGKERIDVKVYYISAKTLGQTSSNWKHIEYNSSLCVKNVCKRRTTGAHELFHRVQYAYGYVSGTADMKWMTEGTAAWSQKYTNEIYRDYMARMNSGLASPNVNLITTRSYDACHFWVFLQERSSYTAIKQVWATYQTNGKKAKEAVNTVTNARLGLTFDEYVRQWSKANYIKDLTNAATGGYNYLENAVTKTSCGVTYGPLSKVPITARPITPTSSFGQTGNVTPYGARYHVYALGSTVNNLDITFKGTGSFAVSFIGLKNDAWKPTIVDTTANTYNYKKTLTPGQWDKLVVVVMGTATGGTYTISVNPPCVNGWWKMMTHGDFESTYYFNLTQNGTVITGTWLYHPEYEITGTFTPPNITLNLTNDPLPAGTCNVTFTGTINNCNAGSGTWFNSGNDVCHHSGTWEMTKEPGTSSLAAEDSAPAGPTSP
jgi:hypothetical protein